jgi:hypothetical protein
VRKKIQALTPEREAPMPFGCGSSFRWPWRRGVRDTKTIKEEFKTIKEEFKEFVSFLVSVLVLSLVLSLVGAGVWVWWVGSHVPDFSNALEVLCVDGTGLDDNNLCLKPKVFGDLLEFQVNTQKVLITYKSRDGRNFDTFLEHCLVVDTANWKCIGPTGHEVWAMSHGRYYHSQTGDSLGSGYYYSSISGETFWKLHDNSISVLEAMESTGYSRKSLAKFENPELQQEVQRTLARARR